MTTEKKIVHYVVGSLSVFDLWGKKRASLIPINHPNQLDVINGQGATTSSVLKYDEATGVVETKNTIYVPAAVIPEVDFADSALDDPVSEYSVVK